MGDAIRIRRTCDHWLLPGVLCPGWHKITVE
jgi:hypothetical protein